MSKIKIVVGTFMLSVLPLLLPSCREVQVQGFSRVAVGADCMEDMGSAGVKSLHDTAVMLVSDCPGVEASLSVASLSSVRGSATKGSAAVGMYDEFRCWAFYYDRGQAWNSSMYPNYLIEPFKREGDVYFSEGPHMVPEDKSFTFFASAPTHTSWILESGPETSGEPVLVVRLPGTVVDVADMLVAGPQHSLAFPDASFKLHFRHILSGVRFVLGSCAKEITVDRITMYVFNLGDSYFIGRGWEGSRLVPDQNMYAYPKVAVGPGTPAGESLMGGEGDIFMIPQTGGRYSRVQIEYTLAGKKKYAEFSLTGVAFEEGMLNTVKVNFR